MLPSSTLPRPTEHPRSRRTTGPRATLAQPSCRDHRRRARRGADPRIARGLLPRRWGPLGSGTTSTGTWGDSSVRSASDSDGTVWDSSSVHSISVDVDEDEYAAMLAAFVDSGEKEWITATVTIDGRTFTDVGMRLKGNSSLRSVARPTRSRRTCPG